MSTSSNERRRHPPDAVSAILSVVRLLPPGEKVPDFYKTREKVRERDPFARWSRYHDVTLKEHNQMSASDEDFAAVENRILNGSIEYALVSAATDLEALGICIEGLPNSFVEYVAPPPHNLSWLDHLKSGTPKYEQIAALFLRRFGADSIVRNLILFESSVSDAVLRLVNAFDWYGQLYDLARLHDRNLFEGLSIRRSLESRIPVKLTFDQYGLVRFQLSEFAQAFSGISLARIKICESCGRVYWAGRLDAKVAGCSKACSTLLRTRKWRENMTPEKKLKYKINRVRKEEQKENDKERN
jgi:hypothetical protein